MDGVKDVDMESPSSKEAVFLDEFNTVDFRSVPLLSRRIGHRYGFSAVSRSRNEIALLGGAVHFEFSSSQSAASKGDVGRGNPVPFSQVHCIGTDLSCSLLSISSAAKELPCPRLYHSGSKLGTSNAIVVFGGQAFNDKRKLADIWILSMEDGSGVWKELAPASRSTAFPPPRCKHAVTSVGSKSIIVSGGSGFEDTLLGDLWMATIEENESSVVWKKINCPGGKTPPARRAHALSPMVSDCEFLLHGGVDVNGTQLNDLWIGQLVGEDKGRCLWTQLVSAPLPRSGNLMLLPMFGPEQRELLVFGGNQSNAEKYNLGTGKWSLCYPEQKLLGQGHSFVPAEIDFAFPLETDGEEKLVHVPSVLLVPDILLRANPCDPILASIFPINPRDEGPEGEKEKAPSPPPLETPSAFNLEASVSERRSEYRLLADHLPSIPPPAGSVENGTSAMMAVDSTSGLSKAEEILASIPQSSMFVVDCLVTGLFEPNAISVSSWGTHVLATSSSASIGSLEELRTFVNTESTWRAIAESANSCLVVVSAPNGDKLLAFISEALNRHSLCSQYVSPVVSLKSTNYAQIYAVLKLVMNYTPFKSPAAIQELFSLFPAKGAGFVLIDTDGESENIAPVAKHHKPVLLKDSTELWTNALLSFMRPRTPIEQYALTLIDSVAVSINGKTPNISLKSALKSKLLQNPKDVNLGTFGAMTLGKLKGGTDAGILVYSEGTLIRHIKGRFPFEHSAADEDELEAAINNVTGVVEVGNNVFTPIHGALSDFQEAVSKTTEWTQFVNKVQEVCLAYIEKN
jgi:hypothetical protein